MKAVLFLQHGDTDRPGLLADVLESRGVRVDVRRPDLGDPVPEQAVGFDGLAIGGGAQSVCETASFPYLADEARLVRAAEQAGMPIIGLCLGAQVMASALGGTVRRAPQREIGFFDVTLDPLADSDPLWHDLPRVFPTTHWHGDTFDLPPGAVKLASSARTDNQLFRFGTRLYGLQFHLEMTPEIFRAMAEDSRDYLTDAGVDVGRAIEESGRVLPGMRSVAETVFARWAMLA
jgi:GMP synthase (glutamine-hydrolysing)